MHTAVLKQVEDCVMVELPTALLREMHAAPGQTVTLRAEESGVALAPFPRRRYALQELLDRCDFSLPQTEEEHEWVSSPAVGRELL